MYFSKLLITSIFCLSILQCADPTQKTHVFILSGQSNMARLDPDLSFTPAVKNALKPESVIVIKDALAGQPIRRWYKNWEPHPNRFTSGEQIPVATGDLYDSLLVKINEKINNIKPVSITFLWMQGERDAREGHGEVYASSLKGLIKQLETDLERTDINVVIGRLSDFDMENSKYPH